MESIGKILAVIFGHRLLRSAQRNRERTEAEGSSSLQPETPIASRKISRNQDRISDLHESVLSKILSRLSFKEAVRTSILSRDWQLKWTCIDKMNIIDDIHKPQRAESNFANFVNRVLCCYSHNFTSICFSTQNKYSLELLASCISYMLHHNVEVFEFSYKPSYYVNEDIVLRWSLLTSSSLKKLNILMPCTFKNVDAKSCFLNLNTLHLSRVRFENGNPNIDTLSLTFPVLETFETTLCKWVNVKVVEIYAPALTKFYSRTLKHEVRDYMIRIRCPRLAKFETTGNLPENIVMVDSGSQVVCACLKNYVLIEDFKLRCDITVQVGKLLSGFLNLEELWLSSFLSKALGSSGHHLPCYDKLRRLRLPDEKNDPRVFGLLHAAPQLKYLYINVDKWENIGYDYDAIEYTPSCIKSHLEEVEIKCFSIYWPQIKLLELLLKCGGELKKLSFPNRHNDRKILVEQLSRLPRRSKCLTMSFNNPHETFLVT